MKPTKKRKPTIIARMPSVPRPSISLPSSLNRGDSGKSGAEPVPRITNESIAAHREEVLGSARKYIYPLRHSKHRVVKISITIFVVAVILFSVGCVLQLYKFQNTSSFMYGVTRIVPFPIAKAGPRFVSYDSYLFELRHYMHYYQSQQGVNFATDDGKRQLDHFKQESMQQAVNQAYVKQLAQEHHVTVSAREVESQVALVRQQNRLGASDAVFRSVLQQFWGWSVADFKRELTDELLEQKVVSKLDTGTNQRAQNAFTQLVGGADFATLAKEVSDDTATAANGGEYGFDIDTSSQNISPQAVQALYKLKVGQYTEIINSGSYLEIDKLLQVNGTKLRAAHLVFSFKDVGTYLGPEKAKSPTHYLVHV